MTQRVVPAEINVVRNFGWHNESDISHHDYLAPVILDILARLRIRRVLDIGCGNGALCDQMQKRGFDCVGIDQDANGINLAKTSFPTIPFYPHGLNSESHVLLAAEQPFDAVVSTEVIEHLFAPHLLPRYAAAVLKENGYLIISTPYHGYLKNLALALLGKWDSHADPLQYGGHIKFWSKRTLKKLVKEAGFEVIDFIGAGRFPFFWKSMVLVARKASA